MVKTFKKRGKKKKVITKGKKNFNSESKNIKLNNLDEIMNNINTFYKKNKKLCQEVFEYEKVDVCRNILLGKKKYNRHTVGGANSGNSQSPIYGPEPRPVNPITELIIHGMFIMFIVSLFTCCLCINECIWEVNVNRRRPPRTLQIHEGPGTANIFSDMTYGRENERERRQRRQELTDNVCGCLVWMLENAF
jgi:hypothetical protein